MDTRALPDYAVFDDYRHYVRIAVLVRWSVLAVWFVLHNTRVVEVADSFYSNNAFVSGLTVLNAYVSWRLWTGRWVTRSHSLVISAFDLIFITVGVFTTTGFSNSFFVLYYPALLALGPGLPPDAFPPRTVDPLGHYQGEGHLPAHQRILDQIDPLLGPWPRKPFTV